jgi:hypothetical protein
VKSFIQILQDKPIYPFDASPLVSKTLEKSVTDAIIEWLLQKRGFAQSYKFAYGCPANQHQQGELDLYDELIKELSLHKEETKEGKQ